MKNEPAKDDKGTGAETPSAFQTIMLSREQYFALLKLAYMGEWMANAHRDGSPEEPRLDEYEAMKAHLVSFAEKFGYSKEIEHELEYDERGMPTEVFRLINEYDDNTFWEEIAERLGERDFFRRFTSAQRETMSFDEHFVRRMECAQPWEDEFEDFGLERIVVKEGE